MTSKKQIEANKKNARKSTGPRTTEGKLAASKNSIKHGLLARHAVITGEDEEEFDIFCGKILEDLAPSGEIEIQLAERIATAFWKLKRAGRLETELLNFLLIPGPGSSDRNVSPSVIIKFSEPLNPDGSIDETQCSTLRAQARDKNAERDRRLEYLENKYADQEQASNVEHKSLGQMLHDDFTGSQLLSRFRRYETQIENSLFHTLSKLDELQDRRRRNEAIEVLPE